MRLQTYEELIRAIANFNGEPTADGKEYVFNRDVLSIKESNQMNVTVKEYGLPSGMSRRFFSPELNTEVYKMVGPLGKGLGITEDTRGTHFAYSAGTGILVFIDLIARMLCQELGVIPDGY